MNSQSEVSLLESASSEGQESSRPAKRPRLSKRTSLDVEEVRDMYDSLPQLEKDFEILSKIGEGTFSTVYLAKCRSDPEGDLVAIKNLVPTSSCTRIENEIYCLQKMGGKSHVIPMLGFIRNRSHIALVLPYFKHERFTEYFSLMSVCEVRGYMRALFEALKNVHSHGVIHRDVKPSNFLYDRSTQRYQLVDFGLAHLESQSRDEKGSISSILKGNRKEGRSNHHHHHHNNNNHHHTTATSTKTRDTVVTCPVHQRPDEICERCMARPNQIAHRAGTPGFRAPEVLMKHPLQTTAVDIWSAGVILLSLLSHRYPFFRAHDDMSAMAQIVGLFGSAKCAESARSLGKTLVTSSEVPPMDLKRLCENYHHHHHHHHSAATPPSDKHKLRRSPRKIPRTSSTTASSHLNESPPSTDLTSTNQSPKKTSSDLHQFPDSVYELLNRCLDLNPQTRITAEGALKHEFLTDRHKR